ncbi:MAG TPA: hypothetical protein VE575_15970 [Acidimicrobiales bacterium]|jgi:hypothetical protein|nr:hypothetical protein [Acidimicrobiales bacterium]
MRSGVQPHPTPQALRPLLGTDVIVRTPVSLWRGRLLSCVRDSAWFVVDDDDVVVHLHEILSIRAA